MKDPRRAKALAKLPSCKGDECPDYNPECIKCYDICVICINCNAEHHFKHDSPIRILNENIPVIYWECPMCKSKLGVPKQKQASLADFGGV